MATMTGFVAMKVFETGAIVYVTPHATQACYPYFFAVRNTVQGLILAGELKGYDILEVTYTLPEPPPVKKWTPVTVKQLGYYVEKNCSSSRDGSNLYAPLTKCLTDGTVRFHDNAWEIYQ